MTPAELRAHLQSLPRETLRAIVENALAPNKEEPIAPDGSQVIRVPAEGGRTLAFRYSADDLNL
jgi:hypothetical protein